MITRTFLTAIVLLTLYAVFVSNLAPSWWVSAQSQWQKNISRAQIFLYNDSDTLQNVIVGSSLSERLLTDSLPATYNLAFSGKSAFDGLNLLESKTTMPKKVFIETNFIHRPPSPEFTSLINNSVMYYPRKLILGLREDKQPMAIFGLMQVNGLIGFSRFILNKPAVKAEILAVKDKPDEVNPIFKQLLNIQSDYFSEQPKESRLDSSFTKLLYHVKQLEGKGVKVIFFEMPINKDLEKLPLSKAIRHGFQKHFPTSQYTYLSLPASGKFHTTDGVHLGKNEALTYTLFFKTEMQNIR